MHKDAARTCEVLPAQLQYAHSAVFDTVRNLAPMFGHWVSLVFTLIEHFLVEQVVCCLNLGSEGGQDNHIRNFRASLEFWVIWLHFYLLF